ncbi:MAG: Type pilin N-term methylation site GFxxxE [Acidobacteria bacterium]|nr:Type pilin N-term methylation site GFxxxE [Acidobacteriota bacterium]
METNTPSRCSHTSNRQLGRHENGFSLLEMVVAMFILTVGLLGVASAIGYALMASNSGRGLTNAKLLVVSSLEQMETLRNSGQLNFAEISNAQVVGSSFAGFPAEFLPVSTVPGADFVYGTLDDPGRTDPALAVNGVTRQILITSLSPTLKRIQVTLQYSPNGGTTQQPPLVGVSYLNDDEHGNYVP